MARRGRRWHRTAQTTIISIPTKNTRPAATDVVHMRRDGSRRRTDGRVSAHRDRLSRRRHVAFCTPCRGVSSLSGIVPAQQARGRRGSRISWLPMGDAAGRLMAAARTRREGGGGWSCAVRTLRSSTGRAVWGTPSTRQVRREHPCSSACGGHRQHRHVMGRGAAPRRARGLAAALRSSCMDARGQQQQQAAVRRLSRGRQPRRAHGRSLSDWGAA